MAEGLFARRIRDYLRAIDGANEAYRSRELMEKHILKIVEEAKADYPSLTSLGLVPILSDEDIMKVSEARHKWFLRWFVNGGVKEK